MKHIFVILTLLALLIASPAYAQTSITPLPERVCVNDPAHGRIEVNTIARTFRASLNDGQEYSGNLELFEPTSELEYVMLGGSVEGFRFFSNSTYKRFASFAWITQPGGGFQMWNREHLDCDGNPTQADPYTVHIYPRNITVKAGESVMLCAVPSDYKTLTTWEWSIAGRSAIGQMPTHTFTTPGLYTVRVKATYIDIEATDEMTITVIEPDDAPPDGDDNPPAENEAPAVQIEASSLTTRPKKKGMITLTARAEDQDGEIASILWDFGDGTTSQGASVEHFYKRKGSYLVTCRVRDDLGAEASASITINVRK